MLKLEKIFVSVGRNEILRDLDLKIKKDEKHILIGPNASGKSSLAKTIMGFPEYKVKKGKIIFNGRDVTKLKIEQRARMGIALFFQEPPVVEGVKLGKLIEVISKSKNRSKLSDESKFLPEKLLERDINLNFSGGEKKIAELAQIINLNPKFVIFDELDSGLDLEKTKNLIEVLKKDLFSKKNFFSLMITHSGNIINLVKPDFVHIMMEGKIICSSSDWKKVWEIVKKYGFEKCKKCQFSSNR